MNEHDFEQHLDQQPPRPIPGEWRSEILAAARAAAPAAKPSGFGFRISDLLWPHPKAWAGLAAVWLVIILVNVSGNKRPAVVAKVSPPLSREMMLALVEQRKMFVELLGPKEIPVTNRPKPKAPLPHSQRPVEFSFV